MGSNDERKFSDFLKANKTNPSSAPTGEDRRIWRAISLGSQDATQGFEQLEIAMSRPPGLNSSSIKVAFFAAASVVLVLFFHGSPQPSPPTEAQLAEIEMIEESLQLGFMEGDELDEIAIGTLATVAE